MIVKRIEVIISGDGINSAILDLTDEEVKVLCKVVKEINNNAQSQYDPLINIHVIKDKLLKPKFSEPINPMTDALKNIHIDN